MPPSTQPYTTRTTALSFVEDGVFAVKKATLRRGEGCFGRAAEHFVNCIQ
jgi:hypothetical protein